MKTTMKTNWDYIEGYKEEVAALIQQRLQELHIEKMSVSAPAKPVAEPLKKKIYARIGARVEIPVIHYSGTTVAACA